MGEVYIASEKKPWGSFAFLFYFTAIAVFILGAYDTYSLSSRVMAWSLFILTTAPAFSYYFNNRDHVPILELVFLNYALSFALPVLYQQFHLINFGLLTPDELPITETLSLAILAVISLYYGYKAGQGIYPAFHVPKIRLACSENKLFIFAVVTQSLYILDVVNVSPQFAQVVNVVVSPTLNAAILALLFYKGSLSRIGGLVAISVLCLLAIKGIVSGMTQQVLEPLLVWFLCRWIVTAKIPVLFLIAGSVIFILSQPVKLEYRNTILFNSMHQYSKTEMLGLYADIFAKTWLSEDKEGALIESTQSRTSLLLTTAHIINWTPEVVPYKNGETLSYMFISWIPRFLWPEKPTAQESNIRYAIDYGITTELGTQRTMFGAGHLGDVYMNFGALGIIPIYLILGMLYFLPLHMLQPKEKTSNYSLIRDGFENKNIDVPISALLMATTINLIMIGSSVSHVFGGLIQQLFVQALLLHVFCRSRKQVIN